MIMFILFVSKQYHNNNIVSTFMGFRFAGVQDFHIKALVNPGVTKDLWLYAVE